MKLMKDSEMNFGMKTTRMAAMARVGLRMDAGGDEEDAVEIDGEAERGNAEMKATQRRKWEMKGMASSFAFVSS
jgi:hypothetical protein